MDTWLLDEAIVKRRERLELQRRQLLKEVEDALDKLKIDFDEAYIFGSLARPYQFLPHSDIDICFVGLDKRDFFKVWAELTRRLSYDNIQILRMEEIDFKEKILKEGILWKRKV